MTIDKTKLDKIQVLLDSLKKLEIKEPTKEERRAAILQEETEKQPSKKEIANPSPAAPVLPFRRVPKINKEVKEELKRKEINDRILKELKDKKK